MIVTDGTLTLTDVPILCWRNIVTTSNVNDIESDPDFPAVNVANPSTRLKWKHDATNSPESAIEYFIIDVSQANPINYIAIAGHNFSSASIAVGLEIASYNSPVGGAESLINPFIPDDDGPLIFLFREIEAEAIRIILVTGSPPAEMAVVYAGEYTQLPEGIQGDHTPLPLALTSNVSSGKSENGQFLGRIVLNQHQESTATISNFTKTWARDELQPFLEFAAEYPFFWAWSPSTYDGETAYAWLANDPQPSFDIDGYGSVDLAMRGVVS